MSAKRKAKIDPIPEEFPTLEAAAEFWDTHDLTDYLEHTRPVKNMTFKIKKRHYMFELDEDLVEPLREKAYQDGTTRHALVNRWIRERLKGNSVRPRKRKSKEVHS